MRDETPAVLRLRDLIHERTVRLCLSMEEAIIRKGIEKGNL